MPPDDVLASIRARVHPAGGLPARPAPVTRDLGAGLVAALWLADRPVVVDDVRGWRAEPGDLWDVAVHALRRTPVQATYPVDGVTILVGDETTAANVLRLAELLEEPAPDGVLVALPDPRVLLLMPVRSAETLLVRGPAVVRNVIPRFHRPGGALTPDLLWWTPPGLEPVRFVPEEDGTIRLQGSQRFVDVLYRLVDDRRP